MSLPPSLFAKESYGGLNFRRCPARKQGRCAQKSCTHHFQGRAGLRDCELSIAECGLKKKTPKSETGNPKLDGPMLFARNALASRPQAGFSAEKRIVKVKGGKA
jgi:hypothetical protein